MRKLGWVFAPLAAGLVALVMACGGDDGDQSNSNSGSSGGGASVSQELNLAEAATQLMDLRSFRFDMSFSLDFDLSELTESGDEEDEFAAEFANAFLTLFSDISMEGAYVAPDSFDMKMSLAGEEAHMIQIGDEAWVNDGSGWVATDPAENDLTPFGDPTEFAIDFLPDEVLQNAEVSSDSVGGVSATKYHFDKDSLQALATELGEDTGDFNEIEEMTLDIWLAEGNVPLKFIVSVAGTDPEGGKISLDATFEISDLNADIEIERPI